MHPTLGLQSPPLQLPSETSPRPSMPRASRHLRQTPGLPAGLHWDIPSPSNPSWLLGPLSPLSSLGSRELQKTGLCLTAPRCPDPASPGDSSSQLHVCVCTHAHTSPHRSHPHPRQRDTIQIVVLDPHEADAPVGQDGRQHALLLLLH